jgi:hypothetical protein
MCWFSTEYANQIEDAKAGHRLGIKRMNWHFELGSSGNRARRPKALSGLPNRSDQGPVSVLRKSASVAPPQHRGGGRFQNVKKAEAGRL